MVLARTDVAETEISSNGFRIMYVQACRVVGCSVYGVLIRVRCPERAYASIGMHRIS